MSDLPPPWWVRRVKPLPADDPPPFPVRLVWRIWAEWITWPYQTRQLRKAGFRRTGWKTWEYP